MIDGPNLYVYLNNNPLNDIDPWGLCGGDITGTEYSRPLEAWWAKLLNFLTFGLLGPRHKFFVYNNGNSLVEMDRDRTTGNIKVINIQNDPEAVQAYLNKYKGSLRSREVRINYAAFRQRIATYTARYGNNHPYNALNHNSNYAVNYMIYGRGNAPGGGFLGWSPLGWAPPFAGGD